MRNDVDFYCQYTAVARITITPKKCLVVKGNRRKDTRLICGLLLAIFVAGPSSITGRLLNERTDSGFF